MFFECCFSDPQREMYHTLLHDAGKLVQAKMQVLEEFDKTFHSITRAKNLFLYNFSSVLERESEPSTDSTSCPDCDCDVVLIFTGDDGKRYYDTSMIDCDHYCPGCGQLHLGKNMPKRR